MFDFELNWSDGFNGTLAILPAEGGKPEVVMEGVVGEWKMVGKLVRRGKERGV